MSANTAAGYISSIWRYPVKSMQGEEVTETTINTRGVLGDRTYCLLDIETGHIVSAKHPGKWRQVLACQAVFVETPQPERDLPPVTITLPDGVVIESQSPRCNTQLSDFLGREVALIQQAPEQRRREANRAPVADLLHQEDIRSEPLALAAPEGTFFDYAPIHLITTATLQKLRELGPAADFDVRRFRPNLLITLSTDVVDFVENAWLGQQMRIGETLVLDLLDPTPRCVVTTLSQAERPQQLAVLKTIAAHNAAVSVTAAPGHLFQAVAGIYASARHPGQIRMGDAVRL